MKNIKTGRKVKNNFRQIDSIHMNRDCSATQKTPKNLFLALKEK